MPRNVYRRKRMRRRRYGGYGNYKNALALATTAWKGVKYLKGLVNSEMYKVDVALSSQAFSTTGAVTHLTAIGQGDTDATRTGNSVLLKSLDFRMLVQRVAANTVIGNLCTCLLVQDNQQIGDTSPAIADVLEGATGLAFLNNATVGRFKILRRWDFCLDTVGDNARVLRFRKYWPQGHHVRYNGTSSADQQKGAIYFLCMGDQATNNPVGDGSVRISYHDN